MADDLLGIGDATTEISKGLIGLLQTLFGPATDEAGQILADRVRYWRWKNSLSIMAQVNQTLIDKKITPRQIPLKTLIPIMEGVSVEDESKNLKAKWINLISNAAAGKSVHPKYIKLFSELDSIDAVILDTVFSLHKSHTGELIRKYFDSSTPFKKDRKRGEGDLIFEYPDDYQGNLAVISCVKYLKGIKQQEVAYEVAAESVRYLGQLNLIVTGDPDYGARYYSNPRLTTLGLGFLKIVSEPEKSVEDPLSNGVVG